ncbi:hypothetical protein HPB47_024717, partial [Ixodes persulcatus]
KLRNPMAHPFLVLQKVWENRRDVADKPIMDLNLYTSLHPSLKEPEDGLTLFFRWMSVKPSASADAFGTVTAGGSKEDPAATADVDVLSRWAEVKLLPDASRVVDATDRPATNTHVLGCEDRTLDCDFVNIGKVYRKPIKVQCRGEVLLRSGSVFEGSHQTLPKLMKIIYLWCQNLPIYSPDADRDLPYSAEDEDSDGPGDFQVVRCAEPVARLRA